MSSREVVERLRSRRVRGEVDTAEGSVLVRGLTGKERDEYYNWIRGDHSNGAGSILLSDQRIISIALCDESGAPLFASIEEGVDVVGDWNMDDVTTIAKEVLRLSGMNRGATDDAEKK